MFSPSAHSDKRRLDFKRFYKHFHSNVLPSVKLLQRCNAARVAWSIALQIHPQISIYILLRSLLYLSCINRLSAYVNLVYAHVLLYFSPAGIPTPYISGQYLSHNSVGTHSKDPPDWPSPHSGLMAQLTGCDLWRTCGTNALWRGIPSIYLYIAFPRNASLYYS